jgi:hypothetical protein
MNELFTVQAECRSGSTKGLRQMKIVFDTQENLSDASVAKIATWAGKHGHLIFLSEEPTENDIKNIVEMPRLTEEDMGKSPAARLRNILYWLWDFSKKPTQTFEEFYRIKMETIIESIKAKMN